MIDNFNLLNLHPHGYHVTLVYFNNIITNTDVIFGSRAVDGKRFHESNASS